MAQVCKWLCFNLCYRDTPKDKIHPDSQMFDAIIVWKENPKEKTGGMAYDVILKPANASSAPRPTSPPKERPVSQHDIEKKLKLAEERRQSMEAAKLQHVQKDEARRQEAVAKIADLNDSFSKMAEKKLTTRLETMEERKNAQIRQLQDRLQDHAKRVSEVRKASDEYTQKLKERIEQKIETKTEKREAQLQAIQERIREHEKHVAEVLEASNKFSKKTESKMIQKMEVVLKNREEQIRLLMDRLKEHDKHAQEVRTKKLEKVPSSEGDN